MPEHKQEHEVVVRISPSGACLLIYDEEFQDLLDAGECKITRAAHVEPDTASMAWWVSGLPRPAGTPATQGVLGPYMRRSEALAAERHAVQEHLAR